MLLTGCGVLVVLLAASWFYWDRIMASLNPGPPWEGAVLWRLNDGGNGHVYEVVAVPGRIDWLNANRKAIALGGYLATITSEAENDFVTNLVDEVREYWVWTGGGLFGPWLGGVQPPGSPEPGGGWQWVTEEAFGFADWAKEPINPNDQNGTEDRICFVLPRTAPWSGPAWSDESASKRLAAYIVEYDQVDQRRGR